jgi:hypothetical protein
MRTDAVGMTVGPVMPSVLPGSEAGFRCRPYHRPSWA